MPNKNNYKLTWPIDQERNEKQEAFLAKNQAKFFKAQKAQTETEEPMFLNILKLMDDHKLLPHPCSAMGSLKTPKPLPQEIPSLALVSVKL